MTHIISRSVRSALRRAIAAAPLVLVACGAPTPVEPPTTAERTAAPAPASTPAAIRIAVLGDSLAAGMGLAEADAFPAVTEDLLRDAGHPVEVLNAGVSGDTSAGGLSRIDWVLTQRPNILVVELGGNDALRGQPLANTERNLREIISRGRDAGARVLLLGMDVPINYGPDYGTAFAEMYERIATDEQIDLVPGFVREVGVDPTLMQADGLHPTAEGHRRLAAALIPHLEQILEAIGSSAPTNGAN
jgi:acyl-CoA thioesterase-1